MSRLEELDFLGLFFNILSGESYKVTGSVALFSFGVIDEKPKSLEIVVTDYLAIEKRLMPQGVMLLSQKADSRTYCMPKEIGVGYNEIKLIKVDEETYSKLRSKKLLIPTRSQDEVETIYPKEIITSYLLSGIMCEKCIAETVKFLEFI